MQRTIFLSLPITANLGDGGIFRPDRRAFYASIIDTLRASSFAVTSAVLNEDWGCVKLPVREFTAFDLRAIEEADGLVVVSSEPLSRDIYLEIGLALGRGLPVVVACAAPIRTTFMLSGLAEQERVAVGTYADERQAHDVLLALLQRVRWPDEF